MNKTNLLTAAVVAVTLFFAAGSKAKSETGAEYQAVVQTAYDYFNGAANGDQTLLSKAFDIEFGHVKIKVEFLGIAFLYLLFLRRGVPRLKYMQTLTRPVIQIIEQPGRVYDSFNKTI